MVVAARVGIVVGRAAPTAVPLALSRERVERGSVGDVEASRLMPGSQPVVALVEQVGRALEENVGAVGVLPGPARLLGEVTLPASWWTASPIGSRRRGVWTREVELMDGAKDVRSEWAIEEVARRPSTSRVRSAAARSANARCAAAYSCLPSGVSIRIGSKPKRRGRTATRACPAPRMSRASRSSRRPGRRRPAARAGRRACRGPCRRAGSPAARTSPGRRGRAASVLSGRAAR